LKTSRRGFLSEASLVFAGAAISEAQTTSDLPPGSPSAFNTAPPVGPKVSPATFAEAERLVQVQLSEPHRAMAAESWRTSMAALYERRTGPRKVTIEPTVAPWSRWTAVLPDQPTAPARNRFVRSKVDPGPLPANDEDIAFARLVRLSRWIEERTLTSERLTSLYLARLERFNPTLRCVITLTRERALEEARQADREIAAGHYRGPLHGVPWGPARYSRHPDDVWRGTVPRSRAKGRCGGR
jgi:Amidase